jgi:hypothetical protein
MLVFGLTWLLSASDVEQSAKTTEASDLAITQLPLSRILPWQIQTGLRVASLRARVPTVDRVVLVPDEATFLAAIQQWSLSGRWPILIEDQQYTQMFIQRFRPAEIIHLPQVKQPLPTGRELRQRMLRAAAVAWSPTKGESLTQTWQRLGWQPLGVVITSERDPARLAAVALAADRGQPLAFLDRDFGSPNETLSPTEWQSLQTSVQRLVKDTGYPYADAGDLIDTVTIVRQLAVKYQLGEKAKEEFAVTDGLARHSNGQRWAIAGWIYGSPARAIYQAMCSIFLAQKTALFYNSYPNEDAWGQYGMDEAAHRLGEVGFGVELIQRPEAGVQNWGRSTQGLDRDLIFVNTKGGPSSFDLGDGQAFVRDVPFLHSPTAVHFIHSWSATAPGDRNTVGGRWLEQGAYAYVGSVHEPYLQAFISPGLLVERLRLSVPFLIAARQIEAPPWKITTIGDPLMTILKPGLRLSPSTQPIDGREKIDQ